ncbi:MAG: DUF4157 domain-containing protein [Dehalococcoidia bacterium]|jgi:hypothetical protein|nr:DUF4157 domain-containing protein [Dehalococcoidia bacterium]
MGWLRRAARWLSNAADDVAEFVEDAVNAVVEFVSDVIETVGSAFQDAFGWIGDQLGRIPGVGGVLEAIFDWIGDTISWVFRQAATAIKAVGSIIGGALAGAIRIVGGILSLDGSLILEGIWDIFSGVLGAIFVFFPTLLGLIQTATFFGQARSRRLNQLEMWAVRRVYGDSIALNNVRVVHGFAGFLSLDGAAITFGNTIYFKNQNPSVNIALLIHEMCHVWQYQHMGSRYTSDAVAAQIVHRGLTEYNWETEVAGASRVGTTLIVKPRRSFFTMSGGGVTFSPMAFLPVQSSIAAGRMVGSSTMPTART